VTPLVLGLFFGIVEMGLLFKDYLAVAGSVRAGVRMASANPRNSTFAQDAANQVAKTGGAMNFKDVKEMWVYRVALASDKPWGKSDFNSDCDTTMCVKFTWNASTKKFDKLAGYDWASTSQNACKKASGGPPDRIGVYIKLKHDAVTKFVFNSVDIKEASILTLEPMPALAGCK